MMELRRWLVVLCACLAMLTVGCPGGGDDDDDDVPLEDVPGELADVFCTEILPCLGLLEDMFLNGVECQQQFAAQFTDEELARWQLAIEAGTLVYNADLVQDCLDDIAAMGCTLGSARMPESCDEALEGTVALGGDCDAGIECAGVAYCKFEDACPGACTALEAEGEDCDEDDHCADGLACMGGTCTEPAAEGEACGTEDDPECLFGLACQGADEQAGTPGTCQPIGDVFIGTADDACDPLAGGPLCVDGLSCVLDQIDMGPPMTISWVCAEGVGSGDSCSPGYPDPCPDGEACDADLFAGETEGTCVSLPDAGEPCADTMTGVGCAPGLACVDDVCTTMGRIGDPCEVDDGCYSGTCNGTACAAPPLCAYAE